MENTQAVRIISALANGMNPITGEIYSSDSPYQSPDIVRALFVAVRALETTLMEASADRTTHPATKSATVVQKVEPLARKGASDNPASDHGGKSNVVKPKPNVGKPWSADEDKQLLAAFDSGQSLAEIATTHGRTLGGIRARLEKHGRLEPSPASRWPANGSRQPAPGDETVR